MSTTPQLKENNSTSFVCDCEEWMRSACASEVFYREHEGKRYCVLHYPVREKIEAFRSALKRKLDTEDFDFRGVLFPEQVSFKGLQFSADANFYGARFSADANFSGASFSEISDFSKAGFGAVANLRATFSADAYFREARFSAVAEFSGATFKAAEFKGARFSAVAYFVNTRFSANTNFSEARFSADANFSRASFSKKADFSGASFSADADFGHAIFDAVADFDGVTFKDYVYFVGSSEKRTLGDRPQLNFYFAQVEKPDHVSFHTLNLQPHWFIKVDSRKFEFTDVEFNYDLKNELESLKKAQVSAPHRLLSIACRQLAVNSEENHRYGEAAGFRYDSMDLRRLEWLQDRKLSGFQFLHWLYWMASGYGERVTRAVATLFALLVVFAFLFTRTGFERKATQT
jgi:uncharacterized protein YjbI with pentapeptide repeats